MEIISYVVTRINLVDIMLIEISLSEDKYYMIHLYETSKKVKLIKIESRMIDALGNEELILSKHSVLVLQICYATVFLY